MRGVIGCDAELEPGTVIVFDGLEMTIRARATEAQAREFAAGLGVADLAIAPGERFYEVESRPIPIGTAS